MEVYMSRRRLHIAVLATLSGCVSLVPSLSAQTVSKPPREAHPSAYTLYDIVAFALAQRPRLAQAAFNVSAAQGRAYQAGLYPNPTLAANFDELGDRTGPQGINTLPLVSQELVT